MSHDHEHHHHHHHGAPASIGAIFIVSIALNAFFVVIEAAVGLWQDSMSLLSDAGHNLSDVLSLVLVLVAFRLAKHRSTSRYTYGYKKSTVLISLLNALILLVAVGAIVTESIHKLRQPAALDGGVISWTAGAGIVINGLTALLLMKGQKEDLNVRGAFLHMAADTLVSVGVVISGVVIRLTGLYIIDPIVSLIIALVILITTWDLLSDSLRLSLDGIPEGIDIAHVEEQMLQTDNVLDVHHVHIWAISTTENALTAHVVVEDLSTMELTKSQLKHLLSDLGICHATLEIENKDSDCHETC